MLARLTRFVLVVSLIALCGAAAVAQQTPKVTLDVSETVFAVLSAMNACGYDQELGASDPVRTQVRTEIAAAARGSEEARDAMSGVCAFYRDHQQADASRTLAQYVSLALNLSAPPKFAFTTKEAELPPDAAYVAGILPHLQRFYDAVALHDIWQKHRGQYDAVIDRNHDAISKMILATDVYLKTPVSGYLARRFVIYVDPLAAPSKVNARNYGSDYFMVVAPEHGALKVDAVRHTYLHFILDPLVLKRANTLKTLEPLLEPVKVAPLDETYKTDIGLLVTESLIRAIEARQSAPRGKSAEQASATAAQRAAAEGFILTPYFNEQLARFEKEPTSIQDSFGGWLRAIDVGRERKRASQIEFVKAAAPDVLAKSNARRETPLDVAESRLSSGDIDGAKEVAQQVLKDKTDDPGRAMYVLAQVATLSKDSEGARKYFEDALKNTSAPRVVSWANVYLGRIYDLMGEREVALRHYRAAVEASNRFPGARSAAEKGLKQPYTSPVARSQDSEQQKNP